MTQDEAIQLFNSLEEAPDPNEVSWAGSSMAWIRRHGGKGKSEKAQEYIEAWLSRKGIPHERGPGGQMGYHLLVLGRRVSIHVSTLNLNGTFQFDVLRGSGMGVDASYLLGIAPDEIKLWWVSPTDVDKFGTARRYEPGFHNLRFRRDKVPPALKQVAL